LLFVLAFVLIGAGWACYGQVRPDDQYRTRDLLHSMSERLLRRLPWLGSATARQGPGYSTATEGTDYDP
jgi:hypothetical protein